VGSAQPYIKWVFEALSLELRQLEHGADYLHIMHQDLECIGIYLSPPVIFGMVVVPLDWTIL